MARRIIAALLIIVASLLAPFAIGALWAARTLPDTELCVETLIEGDEPAFLGGAPWRLRIVEADGTAHLAYDATAEGVEYNATQSGLTWNMQDWNLS